MLTVYANAGTIHDYAGIIFVYTKYIRVMVPQIIFHQNVVFLSEEKWEHATERQDSPD